MVWLKSTIVLVCALACIAAERIRYDGHQVWRIVPKTERQLGLLQVILEQNQFEVIVWKDPSGVDRPVDIMVAPLVADSFRMLLAKAELTYNIFITDVQSHVDHTYKKANVQRVKSGRHDVDTDRYYSLAEIYEYLDELDAEFGEETEIINIGESYEGRELRVLKISQPGENRRAFWLDSTIHAREWIAPATSNYIISRLLYDYDSDPEVEAIRDGFDWYVEPVVNPDGYQFTWDEDRMWRKTRTPNEGSQCVGTDGNRNFDFQWDTEGASSTDPCSQTYRGPSPASEPEIKAIQDFLYERREIFNASVTIHSYGQEYILPWGYNREVPDDFDEMEAVTCYARDMTEAVDNQPYDCRPPNGLLSGNTFDWCKGVGDIKFSILLELRDRGTYGFLLPPELIYDAAHEIWIGMKAMALKILEDYP